MMSDPRDAEPMTVRQHDLLAWLRGEGFPETEEVYAMMEELADRREAQREQLEAAVALMQRSLGGHSIQ